MDVMHKSKPDELKPDIEVLNQLIDEEEGVYRIRFGDKVGYVTIAANVFDEDTMCRPYLLTPNLPKPPTEEWTQMRITRSSPAGPLEISHSNKPLPEIEYIWHDQKIDVLSLPAIAHWKSGVREVLYNGKPAIAKIAPWEWEIPMRERETWAYSVLERFQEEKPDEPWIAPRVLGHLAEGSRVIGLLLEKVEGIFASLENLATCEKVLSTLHRIGLTHGDVNRYNFIVEKVSGLVKLVDFEHAKEFEAEEGRVEMESLGEQLMEDTGRGRATRLELTPLGFAKSN